MDIMWIGLYEFSDALMFWDFGFGFWDLHVAHGVTINLWSGRVK